MSLPTVDEGLGFITYDDVSTNSALLSKQQSDLSGNVTQRQFCIDAFHLAGNRDVSNALIVSDDITTETDNVLASIAAQDVSMKQSKNKLLLICHPCMDHLVNDLRGDNTEFNCAPSR